MWNWRAAAARTALILAFGTAGCERPAALVELRRVVRAADLSQLTDAERSALGCDPCVLLRLERSGRVMGLAANARPDLGLGVTDLLAAEVREHGSLMSDERTIVDLLLVPSDSGRSALVELKAVDARADYAVLVAGEVIAITTPAAWPRRIWIGRFRRSEEADVLRQKLGLPLALAP
jgi:hypothetical protein